MARPPKSDSPLTSFGNDDEEVTGAGATPVPRPCAGPLRLIVVAGLEAGRRFIVRGEATIGRSSECTIPIGDSTVSRLHARLHRDDSGWVTIENCSRQYTLVNGAKITAQPLSFGDKIQLGSHAVLLVTPHDPAERQRLEQDRMQAIGYLSAGIAHDFNNVLGSVLLALGYLDRLPPTVSLSDPEVEDCRIDMRAGLLGSAELVSRLLAFARRAAEDHEECEVEPLCQNLLHLIEHSFDRSIELVNELEPGLWVVGDRSQLSQLLLNLCINARDAMEAGGVLTVRTSAATRHDNEYVLLSVEDTGVGMDEKTREQIFEKFFTTKSAAGGTGLGLATVLEVAKWHGGFVEVESEPRRGAVFQVYLPRSRPEARRKREFSTVEQVHPAEEPSFARGWILVVDDDEMMRRSTVRLLRQAGHEVDSARDGLEAVAMYAGADPRPDLVLLDIDMPRMDGHEAFRQLQQVDPAVRVIFVTGYSAEEGEERVAAQAAVGFLQKPFEASRLLHLIASALAGPS